MIRGLLLICKPLSAWKTIKDAQRGICFVALWHLLPLLILTSAAEAYGLAQWGEWQSNFRFLKKFSPAEAVIFVTGQAILSLLVVFAAATLVKLVATTFHSRHTFRLVFTLVAYSLSPLFMLRVLSAFPAISNWVSWGVGILLAIAVLYTGLPMILEPDPPQAFGLYIMSATLMLLLTGLAHLITWNYLIGKFDALHEAVSRLAGQLPF